MNTNNIISFPEFSGIRCLMMPYIQGDPDSLPKEYQSYASVIENTCINNGDIGFLTIDESLAQKGTPHRGDRAKYGRALHTEAGIAPNKLYAWGSPPSWGGAQNVILDRDLQVLLANNLDDSCAIWDVEREDTTSDGDIGHLSHLYPYSESVLMQAGEVHQIGILTPHESIPVLEDIDRQFLRIISNGVHGREDYFTENPLLS